MFSLRPKCVSSALPPVSPTPAVPRVSQPSQHVLTMPRHMPRPKTSPSKPAKTIAKTIAKPKSKPKVKWAKPKEPKAKSPATEALKALQQRGLPEETIAHRVAALMTGTHAATRDTHVRH